LTEFSGTENTCIPTPADSIQDNDILLMRRMRRCGHLLYHKYNLNFSQNRILLLLSRNGPMTQRALQDEMGIQPGSLSEILSKIEQASLVEKKRSESDKRVWEIHLTDAGRESAAQFETHRRETAHFLFEPLDEAQKETLSTLLDTLLEHWKNPPCEKEN